MGKILSGNSQGKTLKHLGELLEEGLTPGFLVAAY